jgi:hypothetical protein
MWFSFTASDWPSDFSASIAHLNNTQDRRQEFAKKKFHGRRMI